MSAAFIYTILSLSIIAVISAVILYFTARKFKVEEDSRIHEIESVLPSANCGACGYPGCHAFAEACLKAEVLEGLYCVPGGNECMAKIASILGKTVTEKVPMIAVVRCNGDFNARKKTTNYDSAKTCEIETFTYAGDTDCAYGCLGLGDCVKVCPFDAIHMDTTTGLPVVDEDKCTACGKCVIACPKDIIELRKKGLKNRRVFVSCVNRDKGGPALKACKAACIACGKCVKECPFGAIVLENNLAYIDDDKCKLCRKCVVVCPTRAIHEVNFPPRPVQKEEGPESVTKEIKRN
ncbi:MAG: RnfABCDGE type electron transport complex subunit B [Candidatus Omnitrophota bacterium]